MHVILQMGGGSTDMAAPCGGRISTGLSLSVSNACRKPTSPVELHWQSLSRELSFLVYVCVRARACVCASVCECVRVCAFVVYVRVGVHVRVCMVSCTLALYIMCVCVCVCGRVRACVRSFVHSIYRLSVHGCVHIDMRMPIILAWCLIISQGRPLSWISDFVHLLHYLLSCRTSLYYLRWCCPVISALSSLCTCSYSLQF